MCEYVFMCGEGKEGGGVEAFFLPLFLHIQVLYFVYKVEINSKKIQFLKQRKLERDTEQIFG